MDLVEKLKPNTGKPVDQLKYSRAIGCLMYAMTSTRPDIAYEVGRLSRFTSNHSRQHWHAITRIFKFIFYKWMGVPALAATDKELEWLRNMIHEILIWPKPIAPLSIRCDSAPTMTKAYSQIYNGKSRHLGVNEAEGWSGRMRRRAVTDQRGEREEKKSLNENSDDECGGKDKMKRRSALAILNNMYITLEGRASHTDEASGSDLDGDLYFLAWDDHLIPPSKQSWPPMEYTAVEAKELPCEDRKIWIGFDPTSLKLMRMSSDTKRLRQNNGNTKRRKIMEKHVTTVEEIGCPSGGVVYVSKIFVIPICKHSSFLSALSQEE
nr:zinc finger, CCHC-type [Tanacetum cinerariifolium]